MYVWEIVFSAFLVVFGAVFWVSIFGIVRECIRRRQDAMRARDGPVASPTPVTHVPPPLRTRPPPGYAVVEQPCSVLTLAHVV
jgi:flagellar biosynthesis/type III secretory pathway M-ring protein FliF/YscJ